MAETPKITSRENGRLVHARKVRDGKIAGKMLIEGRRLAGEAARSDIQIDECFYASGFRDDGLLTTVFERTDQAFEVPDNILRSITDTENPQGIVLVASRPVQGTEGIASRLARNLPVVVFLIEAANPSNLGAVVRTTEAAGAAGLIISENSADPYSPKALRAAMGSAFRLPIWTGPAVDDVLRWSAERGLITTAAATSGVRTHFETDWRLPRLLVMGSEAHGLQPALLDSMNEIISIPIENDVESLNLAVSAGIILFEAKRQVSEKSTAFGPT